MSAGLVTPVPAPAAAAQIRRPGGFLLEWPTREESKLWGAWRGGYLKVSYLGIKFLQRFAEWGVASVGDQHEAIARLELTLRPVTTAGFLHLELFNPAEARLFILNFKVWKGWNLFVIVNLGARLTAASQSVRGQRMKEIMLEKAKREQADRLRARQFAQKVRRQHAGRPYPPPR